MIVYANPQAQQTRKMKEETKRKIAESQKRRYSEMKNRMLLYDDAENDEQLKLQLAEARNEFNHYLSEIEAVSKKIKRLKNLLKDTNQTDMVEQIARKAIEKIRQTNIKTDYDGRQKGENAGK